MRSGVAGELPVPGEYRPIGEHRGIDRRVNFCEPSLG
jgi:hypothetical protein